MDGWPGGWLPVWLVVCLCNNGCAVNQSEWVADRWLGLDVCAYVCLSKCTTVATTRVIWQADSDKSLGFRPFWREYQDRRDSEREQTEQLG